MKVKDLKEFIFENYYKGIGFIKKDFSLLLVEKSGKRKKTWHYILHNITKKFLTIHKPKNTMNYF